METPFECPHSALENAPPARHTRILRPYIETLIAHDTEKPIHSNPYNRFNIARDSIREETLEYWLSDNENNDDDNQSDSDLSSDSNIRNKRRRRRKRRKLKNNGIIDHDSMVKVPNMDHSNYEFNSNEILHLRQQMFLSLWKRAKSRKIPRNKKTINENENERESMMTLPSNVKSKDINTALIALSGFEKSIEKNHFINLNSNDDNDNDNITSKVSFIKYLSHAINNLFYISLYNQQWDNCYKLFSILLRTFDTDILQIWPLGVYILTQLNTEQFKENFINDWQTHYKHLPLPKISQKIYHDLSFLQNPNLVEPLINDTPISHNEEIIHILKRSVVKKRSMQDTIFKLLKLLMRISRNQFPLIGAFPEQIYVPSGIINHDLNGETDYGTETQTQTETETDATSVRSSKVPSSNNNTEKEQSDDDSVSSDSSYDSEEVYEKPLPLINNNNNNIVPQTSSESESESDLDSEDESDTNINLQERLSSLIIKKSDFNPFEDTRQPFQHSYRTLLTNHSTPIHRHGTRTRTPTFTLSYLWLLVRTGRNGALQRAIEPLLLIVPTSIDARIALTEIMSKLLDVISEIQERKDDKYDEGFNKWENEENIKLKLNEIESSWNTWKDQFTSKKKKKRKGVRQYSNYEDVAKSIENLKKLVNECLKDDKNNNNHNGESNRGYGGRKRKDSLSDSDDSDDIDEGAVEADDDDDEEEIRKEMERLLSYSNVGDEEKNVENPNNAEELEEEEIDDEDDEEVQREMERLMGYSQAIDDEFSEKVNGEEYEEEDDDYQFQAEEEQFINEYVTQDNNDSDSE